MRTHRKAGAVASLASAFVLAITVMASAQTGSTTDPNAGTTDPNATNGTQTQTGTQTQASPNTSTYNTTDPNAATTDSRTVSGTDDYRNDRPDLGWLGLLGLVGLLGLRRRPVTHDRDVREGRPAHA
jgi:MYXO-CTERM domain-containing protein